jgi:hypothetical protein
VFAGLTVWHKDTYSSSVESDSKCRIGSYRRRSHIPIPFPIANIPSTRWCVVVGRTFGKITPVVAADCHETTREPLHPFCRTDLVCGHPTRYPDTPAVTTLCVGRKPRTGCLYRYPVRIRNYTHTALCCIRVRPTHTALLQSTGQNTPPNNDTTVAICFQRVAMSTANMATTNHDNVHCHSTAAANGQ